MRLLAEEVLHRVADLGHAGHAADQDDLGNVGRLEAGVGQRLLARLERALDQILDELLEVGAGDRLDQMLGPVGVGGNEGQIDLGGLGRRQLDLGAFSAFLEALQREPVGAKVDPFLLLELVGEIIDDLGVEILAAEEGVAVGRLHFEHAVADLEDRDVERAAAQIVDRDRLAVLLVHPRRRAPRRSGSLMMRSTVEAGDLAGVLGRLALGVVEIGRDGDHRLRHVSPR